MKQKMTAYTVLMMVLLLAATLFTKQMLPEEFDIGDYSQVDLLQAQAQFEVSQSNEDLVLLCKTLCWRWKASGDEGAVEWLREYGQQLLDRAKAETVDLEKVDDPDVMLAVLKAIRETGAK